MEHDIVRNTPSEPPEEEREYHDKWVMGNASSARVTRSADTHSEYHHHHSDSRDTAAEDRSGREHSGRGRRSSRARRRAKNAAKSLKKRLAKHKWAYINTFVVFVFLVLIAGVLLDQYNKRSDLELALSQTEAVVDGTRSETIAVDAGINLSIPSFESDPVLINGAAAAFVNDFDERFEVYRGEGEPVDVGMPVTIRYSLLLPSGFKLLSSVVRVSEYEDMRDSRLIGLDGITRSASVYGLKTNTDYYYTITISMNDGRMATVGGVFHTADTPRILSFAGLNNVRDLGNWTLANGKTIRQGLLIRGSAVQSSEYVTKVRTADMSQFGFVTEMDLRSRAEASGLEVFEDGVAHLYFDSPAYMDAFSEEGMESMRIVFSCLADEANYPIYLHCSDGGDRTATVCLILEALLGMRRDDILKEHALTDPYNAEELDGRAEEFLSGLEEYPGSSLRMKTVSYLLACGVTEEELDSIADILID